MLQCLELSRHLKPVEVSFYVESLVLREICKKICQGGERVKVHYEFGVGEWNEHRIGPGGARFSCREKCEVLCPQYCEIISLCYRDSGKKRNCYE